MAYADQEMSGNKITAFIIVALIHIAIGYGLISGLAYEAVEKIAERVTAVDIEEPPPPEETPPPPPPEPQKDVAPPPPVAPPVKMNVNPNPPPVQTTQIIPPPAPPVLRIPPPAPVVAPPPPPPPPPPSQARGASPRNQGRWAARIERNYPNRAQREGREGTVGMRLTISPDGSVSGCTVTSSSGHSDLDRAACDGMQRYAQFNPALNDAGNPIQGTDTISFVFRLQ